MRKEFTFLPRGLRSLLDYISPSAFEVIDWKSALKKSTTISKELIFESSVPRLKTQFTSLLPEGVTFSNSSSSKDLKTESFAPSEIQALGQRILEIYFVQIYQCQEVFLDLRKERFDYVQQSQLQWRPSGLLYRFSDEFIQGARELYTGFFADDEASLQSGLHRLGLFSDSMTVEAKRELLGLLEAHFGNGKAAPMKFEVARFMQSFDSLFVFLKKNKIRLSEDFLFLGIYILTPYMHLESLGAEFDVQKAYRASIPTT